MIAPDDYIPLNIGELVACAEPRVVGTVLGSCVSVCLYAQISRVGGIIHYALPRAGKELKEPREQLRYGSYAIPLLVEAMTKLVAPGERLTAKLAGGGMMGFTGSGGNIGSENVQIARELLEHYGIPVLGEHVGGLQGRKLLFHTDTGRLQVAVVEGQEKG